MYKEPGMMMYTCHLSTEEEEAVWAAQRDSDPSDDRTVGRRKEEG